MAPVVLKHDEVLGTYCCVEGERAERVHKSLTYDRDRFMSDAAEAKRLAEPGRCTFIFGEAPAYWLGDELLEDGWEVEIGREVRSAGGWYCGPVARLFTLGHPPDYRNWRDYVALGIGQQHATELIRMALDPKLHGGSAGCAALWAAPHAWRALAQLRAEAAVRPLLSLLRRIDEFDDNRVNEEIPIALGGLAQQRFRR